MAQTGYEKMVKEFTEHWESKLAEALPRMIRTVIEDERQASFSMTLSLLPKKKKGDVIGYRARLEPRERVPGETKEYELRLDEEKQLLMFA